jgi:hypothetical protein
MRLSGKETKYEKATPTRSPTKENPTTIAKSEPIPVAASLLRYRFTRRSRDNGDNSLIVIDIAAPPGVCQQPQLATNDMAVQPKGRYAIIDTEYPP